MDIYCDRDLIKENAFLRNKLLRYSRGAYELSKHAIKLQENNHLLHDKCLTYSLQRDVLGLITFWMVPLPLKALVVSGSLVYSYLSPIQEEDEHDISFHFIEEEDEDGFVEIAID